MWRTVIHESKQLIHELVREFVSEKTIHISRLRLDQLKKKDRRDIK